jgi:hypothetical protein
VLNGKGFVIENNLGIQHSLPDPAPSSPRRDEVQSVPVREFSSEITLTFERLATLALTAPVALSWVGLLASRSLGRQCRREGFVCLGDEKLAESQHVADKVFGLGSRKRKAPSLVRSSTAFFTAALMLSSVKSRSVVAATAGATTRNGAACGVPRDRSGIGRPKAQSHSNGRGSRN